MKRTSLLHNWEFREILGKSQNLKQVFKILSFRLNDSEQCYALSLDTIFLNKPRCFLIS